MSSAGFPAVGNLGNDQKLKALEKQATITPMTELPWDGGRPLMKSRKIWDQDDCWGMGKGWSGP